MSEMYTILIKDDHSFTHSCKKKIMHRSTGIDSIRFLVNPTYGDLDMTKTNTVLEYVTPVSRSYRVVVLQPSPEPYKNRVEYIFPIDLNLTSEAGDVELTIKFSYLSMGENGEIKEQVRTIGCTSIHVEETVHWSDYIASANLDSISQIMLTNQALMEELKVQAELIAYSKADNIAKDEETNEIYLTSNGHEIGNRVKDSDSCGDGSGVPIVDFSSLEGGDASTGTGEANNVVEF